MIYPLIEARKNEWLNDPHCPIRPMMDYMRQRGQLRDAQLTLIEKTEDEKSRAANELRHLLGKIPRLAALRAFVRWARGETLDVRGVEEQKLAPRWLDRRERRRARWRTSRNLGWLTWLRSWARLERRTGDA